MMEKKLIMTKAEEQQRLNETTKFVATCALWGGFILAPIPVAVGVISTGVVLLTGSIIYGSVENMVTK